MTVEVRNLQSGESFEVGPDGAIFGREGGPANIRVQDASVSKRHARIFSDGTEWFLEDMGSVNGTIVDGQKIGAAIPVRAGLVFQMSKQKFEVVSVDGRGPRPQAVGADQETRTAMRPAGNPLPSELRKDPIPKRKPARDALTSQPQRLVDDEPLPPEPTQQDARGPNLPLASDGDFPSQSLAGASGASLPDVGRPPVLGIEQYDDVDLGDAVRRGVGYVLKTAPALVYNPLGIVRGHIENPPLPALEKIPLAAVLAPAAVVIALVNGVAGVLAALLAGSFGAGALLAPVLGAVGGVVGAVLTGFLGHPILRFIVEKLGGTSDARSRTTHMAMGLAAGVVLLVPMALGTILSALAARLASVSPAFQLILLVPALLMIVAVPAPMFVQWSWFRSYNVAKWFQILLLVVAGLGVLGGLSMAGLTVVGAINAMRGAGTPAVASVVAPPEVPPPQQQPPEARADAPDAPTPTAPPPTPTPTSMPVKLKAPSGEYAEYARKRAAIEAALDADPTLIMRRTVGGLYEKLSQQTYNAEIDAEEQVLGRKRTRDPGKRAYLERVKAAYVYQQTRDTVAELYAALGSP